MKTPLLNIHIDDEELFICRDKWIKTLSKTIEFNIVSETTKRVYEIMIMDELLEAKCDKGLICPLC